MTEFNNRIAAQRDVLLIVNSVRWREELYGVSSGALDRWMRTNGVESTSKLAHLLVEVASKLFFLANKSQEQVSDEYKFRSAEVSTLTQLIREEIKRAGRIPVV